MPTTTDKPTIEAIRRRHNQQPPSTITMSEWNDVDFLLAEIDRLQSITSAYENGDEELLTEAESTVMPMRAKQR